MRKINMTAISVLLLKLFCQMAITSIRNWCEMAWPGILSDIRMTTATPCSNRKQGVKKLACGVSLTLSHLGNGVKGRNQKNKEPLLLASVSYPSLYLSLFSPQ